MLEKLRGEAERERDTVAGEVTPKPQTLSSSLLLSSLELSYAEVYEPYIRAPLGTASRFCEVVKPWTKEGRGTRRGRAEFHFTPRFFLLLFS